MFTLSVNNLFGASTSTLASYLINCSFGTTSIFNSCDIANDVAALTLMLSVNKSLELQNVKSMQSYSDIRLGPPDTLIFVIDICSFCNTQSWQLQGLFVPSVRIPLEYILGTLTLTLT